MLNYGKIQKIRLDQLILKRNLVDSRAQAQSLIMQGLVYVEEKKIIKPGSLFKENVNLRLKEKLKYVSRGGLKLEKAINYFKINLKGKIVLDAGASAGGFTDCLLKFEAKKVYAIDVGYGQLNWRLRQDPRVVNLEGTNLRKINKALIPECLDLITLDLSFISLEKIWPVLADFLIQDGEIIALIKPQFEAPKGKTKKGVVRDNLIHQEVLEKVVLQAKKYNLSLKDLTYSPLKGPKGNIEFLAYFIKGAVEIEFRDIIKIAKQAYEYFG
ncbi:MAG: TlyA family RNA methyltransferase [Armatimonadetes bacterium]|nr:TlyA family RNA methyltransferase [Armatimonadota bacterium]